MTKMEILKAACGVGENGYGKSLIKIETKFIENATGREKVFEEMTLQEPVVNIFGDMRHTKIDLIFESSSTYDLVQLNEMLKRFNKLEYSLLDETVETPSIQVVIMPNSLIGQYFINAFHGSWALTLQQPNRLPDTIRFFFDNDTFNIFTMTGFEEEYKEEDDEEEYDSYLHDTYA